ncbi:hypothetical protein PsalN5692_03585 (plasmid) [Piscirickettsia salmonis]|nr:hypothetical protein PsalN5692_03585 [Piscirickettsia salmonis]
MKVFCFGYGYVTQYLIKYLPANTQLVITSRDIKKININANKNKLDNILIINFADVNQVQSELSSATTLLSTVPPSHEHNVIDPVLTQYQTLIESSKHFDWMGYLSATSVYGNQQGNWVDESTPPEPLSESGHLRLQAEQLWQQLDQPWHLFRITGIYGPGRSAFDRLKNNTARSFYKKDVVFNRIHIEDLIQLLLLSMQSPTPQQVYNIADQHPCPPHEVTQFAAQLLNMPEPKLESIDLNINTSNNKNKDITISKRLREFFSENKRVNANKILNLLNYQLHYPSYRDGLSAIIKNNDN